MNTIKLVLRVGFYAIEVTMPEGYSLKNPELFWREVQGESGFHQIIAEHVDGFTILCEATKEADHYKKVLQEAARRSGFFRVGEPFAVQNSLQSSPAASLRLSAP